MERVALHVALPGFECRVRRCCAAAAAVAPLSIFCTPLPPLLPPTCHTTLPRSASLGLSGVPHTRQKSAARRHRCRSLSSKKQTLHSPDRSCRDLLCSASQFPALSRLCTGWLQALPRPTLRRPSSPAASPPIPAPCIPLLLCHVRLGAMFCHATHTHLLEANAF
jgi:hypothetical protein